jgi:hypothetical protein
VRAEQTVSDVIADFIQAAVEGDDDTVAALYPAQAHNAEEGIEEMRQIVSSGMKPGELERTIVRGDRALAISRPGRPEGPSTRLLCLVYTLERRGDGWLITDIDMEEEESVPGEVRRFKED